MGNISIIARRLLDGRCNGKDNTVYDLCTLIVG